MRRVGRRGSDEANGAESPSHGAAIRELVKALLPGKAEWPNGSWQAVTVLLASIALMFRTELGANIFGLSLILASGSFWVGICLTQSDAVKTHVRYRVIASLILSSAAFSFAIYENGFSVKAHLLIPAPPVDGAAGPVSPSLLAMVAGVARRSRGPSQDSTIHLSAHVGA